MVLSLPYLFGFEISSDDEIVNLKLVATRGHSFLLFAQKKRTKEKGTLCTGLRLHCGARFIRCQAKLASLKQTRPLS